jgi:hypothetical protein
VLLVLDQIETIQLGDERGGIPVLLTLVIEGYHVQVRGGALREAFGTVVLGPTAKLLVVTDAPVEMDVTVAVAHVAEDVAYHTTPLSEVIAVEAHSRRSSNLAALLTDGIHRPPSHAHMEVYKNTSSLAT